MQNIKTASATVVVHGARRTIFSQDLKNKELFKDHLISRIKQLDDLIRVNPGAVFIGHIHSDYPLNGNSTKGECTKYIIDKFKKKTIIYANFGNSQINLGVNFWEPYLPSINIFQLNLNEAKKFFAVDGLDNSLSDIVQWFRNKGLSAVITIDRFGAIGIHKDEKDSIILAWPVIDVKDIVDTTGAGDAFAAGMLSKLHNKPNFSFHDFHSAIETARIWAAYACRTFGASGECPDIKDIENYRDEISNDKEKAKKLKPVEFQYATHAIQIMELIDTVYQ